MKMKTVFLSMAVAAALLTTSAKAASLGTCTEISSFPFTISVQGVYCLQSDKSSSFQGNLITINANNVTIDMNGFKLGGLGAGLTTTAIAIFALNRKNITIRNGAIRGFRIGVLLDQSPAGTSSGHLVEDLLLERNRSIGAQVEGSGNVIRNNRVENTGSANPGTEADGILVADASNTVIADNVVSGTSEDFSASGITVFDSTLIEVRDNTILDTKDATTKLGIEIDDSTDVTVIGNRIVNTSGTGL